VSGIGSPNAHSGAALSDSIPTRPVQTLYEQQASESSTSLSSSAFLTASEDGENIPTPRPLSPAIYDFASSKPPSESTFFDLSNPATPQPAIASSLGHEIIAEDNAPLITTEKQRKDAEFRAIMAAAAEEAGYDDEVLRKVINASAEEHTVSQEGRTGAHSTAFLENIDAFKPGQRGRPRRVSDSDFEDFEDVEVHQDSPASLADGRMDSQWQFVEADGAQINEGVAEARREYERREIHRQSGASANAYRQDTRGQWAVPEADFLFGAQRRIEVHHQEQHREEHAIHEWGSQVHEEQALSGEIFATPSEASDDELRHVELQHREEHQPFVPGFQRQNIQNQYYAAPIARRQDTQGHWGVPTPVFVPRPVTWTQRVIEDAARLQAEREESEVRYDQHEEFSAPGHSTQAGVASDQWGFPAETSLPAQEETLSKVEMHPDPAIQELIERLSPLPPVTPEPAHGHSDFHTAFVPATVEGRQEQQQLENFQEVAADSNVHLRKEQSVQEQFHHETQQSVVSEYRQDSQGPWDIPDVPVLVPAPVHSHQEDEQRQSSKYTTPLPAATHDQRQDIQQQYREVSQQEHHLATILEQQEFDLSGTDMSDEDEFFDSQGMEEDQPALGLRGGDLPHHRRRRHRTEEERQASRLRREARYAAMSEEEKRLFEERREARHESRRQIQFVEQQRRKDSTSYRQDSHGQWTVSDVPAFMPALLGRHHEERPQFSIPSYSAPTVQSHRDQAEEQKSEYHQEHVASVSGGQESHELPQNYTVPFVTEFPRQNSLGHWGARSPDFRPTPVQAYHVEEQRSEEEVFHEAEEHLEHSTSQVVTPKVEVHENPDIQRLLEEVAPVLPEPVIAEQPQHHDDSQHHAAPITRRQGSEDHPVTWTQRVIEEAARLMARRQESEAQSDQHEEFSATGPSTPTGVAIDQENYHQGSQRHEAPQYYAAPIARRQDTQGHWGVPTPVFVPRPVTWTEQVIQEAARLRAERQESETRYDQHEEFSAPDPSTPAGVAIDQENYHQASQRHEAPQYYAAPIARRQDPQGQWGVPTPVYVPRPVTWTEQVIQEAARLRAERQESEARSDQHAEFSAPGPFTPVDVALDQETFNAPHSVPPTVEVHENPDIQRLLEEVAPVLPEPVIAEQPQHHEDSQPHAAPIARRQDSEDHPVTWTQRVIEEAARLMARRQESEAQSDQHEEFSATGPSTPTGVAFNQENYRQQEPQHQGAPRYDGAPIARRQDTQGHWGIPTPVFVPRPATWTQRVIEEAARLQAERQEYQGFDQQEQYSREADAKTPTPEHYTAGVSIHEGNPFHNREETTRHEEDPSTPRQRPTDIEAPIQEYPTERRRSSVGSSSIADSISTENPSVIRFYQEHDESDFTDSSDISDEEDEAQADVPRGPGEEKEEENQPTLGLRGGDRAHHGRRRRRRTPEEMAAARARRAARHAAKSEEERRASEERRAARREARLQARVEEERREEKRRQRQSAKDEKLVNVDKPAKEEKSTSIWGRFVNKLVPVPVPVSATKPASVAKAATAIAEQSGHRRIASLGDAEKSLKNSPSDAQIGSKESTKKRRDSSTESWEEVKNSDASPARTEEEQRLSGRLRGGDRPTKDKKEKKDILAWIEEKERLVNEKKERERLEKKEMAREARRAGREERKEKEKEEEVKVDEDSDEDGVKLSTVEEAKIAQEEPKSEDESNDDDGDEEPILDGRPDRYAGLTKNQKKKAKKRDAKMRRASAAAAAASAPSTPAIETKGPQFSSGVPLHETLREESETKTRRSSSSGIMVELDSWQEQEERGDASAPMAEDKARQAAAEKKVKHSDAVHPPSSSREALEGKQVSLILILSPLLFHHSIAHDLLRVVGIG
jgi:hypothetical protein